jgi:iron complex outermembrane receptor protein
LKADQVQPQTFPIPGFGIEFFNDVEQSTKSWALFGQLEYDLTDQLKLTGGLRYTNERKTFFSQTFGYSFGVSPTPANIVYDYSEANPVVGSDARRNDNLWSGKLGLDYKPNADTLIYVSVSRGVKAGGYNTNLNAFPDQAFLDANGGTNPFGTGNTDFIPDTRYDDEHLWAYEGGVKLDLLDRKLRVNASAFYYDYTNFQGYNFRGVAGVVANNDGRFYGGELEIQAAPTDDLSFNLNASYLDTKLFDVSTAYQGIRDTEAAQAPKWTVNGSVTKSFDLSFGRLAFTWDGNFIDDRFTSTDNHIGTFIPGSFVHNARVTLDVEDKGLEFAFFVRNISNNDRLIFSYDTNAFWGNFLQGYAPPRWIGGSVRKTF